MMQEINTVTVLLIAAAVCLVCTSHGPSVSCCSSVSNKRIHPHHIASYFVQEAVLCPVRAIVFHTRRGKNVCADPGQEWVRRAMQMLDEEPEKAGATAGWYSGRMKENGRGGRRHWRKNS